MTISVSYDSGCQRLEENGMLIGFTEGTPTYSITATGKTDCERLGKAILPLWERMQEEAKRRTAIIKRQCTAIELHRDSARA